MKVSEWLVDKDYWQGVELFCRESNNEFLKSLFRGKKDAYNERKLEEELRKLIGEESVVFQAQEILDPQRDDSHLEKKHQNQFLKTKLQHELKQVYRQIDENRFALYRCKTNATRNDYAQQILKLVDKKRDLYAQIDYFDEHGCLPELIQKPTIYKTDELQRLYVQVSKMKARLRKPDQELRNRAKSEQKLREKLARIEVLRGGTY